jgi:hypothetical protein
VWQIFNVHQMTAALGLFILALVNFAVMLNLTPSDRYPAEVGYLFSGECPNRPMVFFQINELTKYAFISAGYLFNSPADQRSTLSAAPADSITLTNVSGKLVQS